MNMEIAKKIFEKSNDENVGLQKQPIIKKEQEYLKQQKEVKKDGLSKGN